MGKNLLQTGWKQLLNSVVLCLGLCLQVAHGFQVTSSDFDGAGHFRVQFEANTNSYYILYRSVTVTNIDVPVSMVLGTGPSGQLMDTNVNQLQPNETVFYRVREVSQGWPLDLDGDRIDDVYEMNHASCLNPFDPGDALLDCGGNGNTNLQVYLSQYDGLVINEVDYDQIGTDTNEFVELYNSSTNSISLAGLALVFVNGANNLEYLRTNLTGVLLPGQYLVVADNAVTVAPGAVVIRFNSGQDNIQNGAPDGVVLFHVIARTPIDSLAYEGGMTAATINGVPGTFNLVDGSPLSASVADSNSLNGSIARSADTHNDSVDWYFSSSPTPGSANLP
jgi:Lamin Tail Domain